LLTQDVVVTTEYLPSAVLPVQVAQPNILRPILPLRRGLSVVKTSPTISGKNINLRITEAGRLSVQPARTSLVGKSVQMYPSGVITYATPTLTPSTIDLYYSTNVQVSGVAATGAVGDVTSYTDCIIEVTGVVSGGYVSAGAVWGVIPDAQTPGWAPVNDDQTGGWTPVDDSQTTTWTQVFR